MAGIQWEETGGVRWNDVAGIRWNQIGGVRWNDVAGLTASDASGVRWNDVAGIRWNDVAGEEFDDAMSTGETSVDLILLDQLSTLPDTSSINVIVTYRSAPVPSDFTDLNHLGIQGGTRFRVLPMVVVNATRDQIRAIAQLTHVRSVYADQMLSIFDQDSRALVGLNDVAADTDLRLPNGNAPSGAGVTIAVLDTGVDATHPDLPYGTKVVGNVRLNTATGTPIEFSYPAPLEGVQNTDLVMGHGTFVASVAAGTGAASGGLYRGAAPGASILSLSAGDVYIINVLEGFDYILDNASRFGVRIVNCSWGSEGWFDPDDPVNIATHLLYDAGITVVFAAGNHGPSADTLNQYSVAPWVIGVGSTRRDGTLSDFSSRGIFEELLYHPVLVAPGEGIIAASPVALNGVNGPVGVADPPAGVTVPPEYAVYYTVSSGTSFSAPHVAGVIALMLEENPALSPGEIKRILQSTATPILTHDRSEVGAGRLDAWASLTQVRDGARLFGTHIPGWLDQRPYRIEFQTTNSESGTVAPQGHCFVAAAPGGASLSWQMTLAWGTLPGGNDLDVRVIDGSGTEVARSESINGTSLFGRSEGVHLLDTDPSHLTLDVYFKGGIGSGSQTFQLRQETATAVLTGYVDTYALAASQQDLVARAVSRHIMVGRDSSFEPFSALTRGELARALALTAGRPQRIPAIPSFEDMSADEQDYPYVETVSGGLAHRILLPPQTTSTFNSSGSVYRLDFAAALVRAAGLETEALARAGERLGLSDEARIPDGMRGYVAVALEHGFITARTTTRRRSFAADTDGGGTPMAARTFGVTRTFDPFGFVPRLDAARYLLELLDDLR